MRGCHLPPPTYPFPYLSPLPWHYLPFSLAQIGKRPIDGNGSPWGHRRQPTNLRRAQNGGPQSPGSSVTVVVVRVGGHSGTTVKCRSPTIPTAGSCFQNLLLSSLFKILPSVPNKSAWIIGLHSCAIRSMPNGALFWWNDPKFVLVTKNTLQQYIIYLCLMSFAKKSLFWDK